MFFTKWRLRMAALVAFVMGIPMAEQARADSAGDIFNAAWALVESIIDIAGDS